LGVSAGVLCAVGFAEGVDSLDEEVVVGWVVAVVEEAAFDWG
jgi:hypothetical protein